MEEASQDLREKGNILFKEGRYADARDQYTEALKHDSSNAVIYSNRSAANAKLNDYELALRDALKCIEYKPQWSKGFLRKVIALEGLHRHDEVMQSACNGFRFTGEEKLKKEFVAHWLKANQLLNRLPEGSIELPNGIVVLSQNYLQVIAYLMRSLDGECPLSLELTEQCLVSCAEQVEQLLMDFSEPVDPVMKEWAKHLPYEIYPYSIKPVAKANLEQQMKVRSDSFISYLNNSIDPTLYPLIRPIMGLVVLVVLNRTNILTQCNTGHHSAELMNRALLPLFESSLLSTDDYYSMYIGRLCAVLDSFIGRGYKLDDNEIATVLECYGKLQRAVENYPRHLPEYHKDKQLAEQALSNVTNNILRPASLSPSPIPLSSTMSVELAEQLVKDKPNEVKAYLKKHLKDLQSAKFLTMGEVEELLTMTGIYHHLGMKDDAVKVFTWGEQAFFQVLGHMLSSHTLKLNQCPATIAPIRQLVLSEASVLSDPSLFANIVLRWKCLFKELRSQLIRCNVSNGFGDFFKWFMKQQTSTTVSDDGAEAALLKQLQDEEKLLQNSAKQTLQMMSETSYNGIQRSLPNQLIVVIDYIFFVPLKECDLLEAHCVVFKTGHTPIICQLDYTAIHKQAAIVTKLLQSNTSDAGRANSELAILASLLFPQAVLEQLTSNERIDQLYISPDSDITLIPFDSLPVQFGSEKVTPLFELFPVSILSSVRKLLGHNDESVKVSKNPSVCSIIGNPNFNLSDETGIGKLINYLCDYFSISTTPTGSIIEQLQYSEEEVTSISHSLQSNGFTTQLFVGDTATLSNVLSLDTPLLLHVSSHAYAASGQSRTAFRSNFFSDLSSAAVALAGFNTFCRGNLSHLPPDCGTAQLPPLAVLSMKLQGTKLVFLSTCSSASGVSPIQESVDSLAEAFLTAGVETVIASLWPIADHSAAEISKVFYGKLLIPGTRPSEALACAKKHFKRQDDNSSWSSYAAFACYGIDRPFIVS